MPQQPVSLPAQSEALVIVEESDPAAQAQIDEDDAWGKAATPDSYRAWVED
ncbi:MAG TPA: hypothetical protein VGR35_00885 [Tepidisphaeraceae bacterium]|nr:hypothetical protein [Tepidisphaeraceae bacterium]